MAKEQDKEDVLHIEKDGQSPDEQIVTVSSAYATLTRSQVVRKFWRLYLTGLGISMAGM
jgi:hypothetical protein